MVTCDLEIIIEGACFDIIFTSNLCGKIEKLDDRKRARLLKQMEMFAEHGQNFIGLKKEGRHSIGDGTDEEIQVFAFGDASIQLRVYGGYTDVLRPKSFTCVSIVEKKKQKANRADLLKAAKILGEVLSSCLK